jgi:hypothetical protein
VIDRIFRNKPPELWVELWTPHDKHAKSTNTFEGVQKRVEAYRLGDLYFGVGLTPKDYGPNRRCPANERAGIGGFWADIDILGEGHKKKNLPPDLAAALNIVDGMPSRPTIVLQTGGGIHAWWLFHELWIFKDNQDRLLAAAKIRAWQEILRQIAQASGYDIDMTADLSRLLRVPNTVNTKYGTEVTVYYEDGPELDPEIVHNLRAEIKEFINITRVEQHGDAEPPFVKFQALASSDPRFVLSWERQRGDFTDQSPSSYDMSLANMAEAAGWEDQEITDLLVASRRKHGDDLKRPDYYAITIAKARQRTSTLTSKPIDALARQGIADTLSTTLGVPLKGILKYTGEPARYVIQIDEKSIALGGVGNLIGQREFRLKLAEIYGHILPGFPAGQWQSIAQQLLNLCEESDAGGDGVEMVGEWLRDYLQNNLGESENHTNRDPFYGDYGEGNTTYIYLDPFKMYLFLMMGERIPRRELGIMLKRHGASPVIVHIEYKGQRTTRSVWRLP